MNQPVNWYSGVDIEVAVVLIALVIQIERYYKTDHYNAGYYWKSYGMHNADLCMVRRINCGQYC